MNRVGLGSVGVLKTPPKKAHLKSCLVVSKLLIVMGCRGRVPNSSSDASRGKWVPVRAEMVLVIGLAE